MLRAILIILAAGSCAAAGGCLVVADSSHTESGIRVTQSTLDQVEPGSTTEQWLLAALGEPTSRQAVLERPGVEILRYEYVRREQSEGAVLFLFAGDKERAERSTAYFEVTDGIVTRTWIEQ